MPGKTQANQNEKLLNAGFLFLLSVNSLSSVAFQMVMPVLSKYVVSLGGSLALGGVVVGLFAITALVMRPVGGAVADSFNRKRVMVISTSVAALMVLGYSHAGSIPLLIVFRIIHGTAFAISGTTNVAFATTLIPKHRMGEGVGILGLSNVLAVAIGPNIGLVVMDHFNYNGLFAISAVIMGTSAFLMTFIHYKHEKAENQRVKFHFQPANFIEIRLIPLAVFTGLLYLCYGTVASFIVVLGDERSIANIGLYFTVASITLIAVRPLSGRFIDKKGFAAVVPPAFIVMSSAMFLFFTVRSIWGVALAAVLVAVGHGSGTPAIQAECIRRQPDRRGVATGTFYMGADVGHGLGPIIGGAVLNSFGFQVLFVSAGILMLIGLLGFIIYRKLDSWPVGK